MTIGTSYCQVREGIFDLCGDLTDCDILLVTTFNITGDAAKPAVGKTYQYDDGKYAMGFEVFHALHCVNNIRMMLYPENYVLNEPKEETALHKGESHFSACFRFRMLIPVASSLPRLHQAVHSMQCRFDALLGRLCAEISTGAPALHASHLPRFQQVAIMDLGECGILSILLTYARPGLGIWGKIFRCSSCTQRPANNET